MKKLSLISLFGFLIVLAANTKSLAQGVSFAYLFPKNGNFSAPVSPFSIRGVGFNFARNFGIESGFTLYSIPGLPIENLPFESNKPFTSHNLSTLVPFELTVGTIINKMGIRLKGGGFGIWHFSPSLNYGNLDRAIAEFEDWNVANADLSFENNLGLGWMTGVELEYFVSQDVSLTFEVHYLSGRTDFPLEGSYTGGSFGSGLSTKSVEYKDASIVLEGLELSLGANF